MNILLKSSIAIAFMVVAASESANGGTLVIELAWNPDPGTDASTKPVVLDLRTDAQLDREPAVDEEWSYAFEFPKAITLPLLVKLDDVPPGYTSSPLRVDLPFSEKENRNTIAALSVKIDSSGRNIRGLYATDPRDVSPTRLHQLYQEAELVAQKRMDRVGHEWGRLNVLDVQAVYKFLETAYVVAERTPIDPASDALRARDWLQLAVNNEPTVVEKALAGTRGAPDLIEHVDQIEGIRFAKLWRSILDLRCPMRIRMMEAFRDEVRALDNPEQRDAVLRTTGVSYAEIQKRINICTRDLAKAQGLSAPELIEVLERQIRASEEEARRTSSEEASEALLGEAGYLRTLRGQVPESSGGPG
jgi:hypothetical protein